MSGRIFLKCTNPKTLHDAFTYNGFIMDHHMVGNTTTFKTQAKKQEQLNRIIKRLDKNKFKKELHNMQIQRKMESI